MAKVADYPTELVVDRRRTVRRALKTTNRKRSTVVDAAPKKATSENTEQPTVERRKAKVERRRQIDPTTCERDYNGEEILFMKAMDDYKRRSGRQFPTWSEVLEVLRDLGYRKVAEEQTTFESN